MCLKRGACLPPGVAIGVLLSRDLKVGPRDLLAEVRIYVQRLRGQELPPLPPHFTREMELFMFPLK